MNKVQSQLVISITPDTLSAAIVRRGKATNAERIELDPTQWNSTWNDGFMRLDQPLRQLLSRFKVGSTPRATVFYQSPTLTQQVHTFELGASAATEMGTVKLRESIGLGDPTEVTILSQNAKQSQHTTTLAYSEREEQLRSLYAWLNRCKVQVDTLVPLTIAAMTTTTQIAHNVEPETAVFYIDADVSVMAYADDSGLKLIRSAEIGYRKLLEGYTQVLAAQNQKNENPDTKESESKNAHHTTLAGNMLFEYGIPLSECVVDGIDLRTQLLPVLAPVLQRFCIEVKQTFRFGLANTNMPKNLILTGPGACIPSIAKAISQHIDMHVKLDPGLDGFSPRAPFGRGTLQSSTIELHSCPGGLLPEIARESRTRSSLTKSLVAGFALALIVMGAEYTTTSIEQQRINDAVRLNSPRLQAVNTFHDQLSNAAQVSNIISDVSELITKTVVAVPEWSVVLSELSSNKPDSIRIQELRGDYSQEKPFIEINGVAANVPGKDSNDELNDFIAALEKIEGVHQITLGATARLNMGDDQWGRQFKLKIELKVPTLQYQAFVQSTTQVNPWEKP